MAWNGFGYEGCAAMGWALNVNTTLQSLDLTCNRIHPPALFELLKGLEKNKMLSSIKVGGLLLYRILIEPVFSKRYKLACAPIKDSDHHALLHSMIRVFGRRCMERFFRPKTKTRFELCGCVD